MFKTPFLKVYSYLWLTSFVLLVSFDLFTKKIATDNLDFHLSYSQMRYVNNDDNNSAWSHSPINRSSEQTNILGKDGSIIRFRLLFNDRFVFGLGPSVPYLSILITFCATIFLFLYHWFAPNLGYSFAWLLVFSGAMGNLIDKLFIKSLNTREWIFSLAPQEGYVSGVVDFIDCIWFGWENSPAIFHFLFLNSDRWPTFNIADSYIVVGMVLLIFSVYTNKDFISKK